MVGKLFSVIPIGMQGILTEIEVDVSGGLPAFHIVGLGDAAVMESRERVRAALKNSGFDFPSRKITVNLAPASIKKEGPGLDLAIALGILFATEQWKYPPEKLKKIVVFGELSLDGGIKYLPGNLQVARAAVRGKCERFLAHPEGAREASFIPGMDCFGFNSLKQIITHWNVEEKTLEKFKIESGTDKDPLVPFLPEFDFAQVRGQESIKRALEIAAGGGHNCLMSGSPGCGKTLMARAFPGILPPLSLEEKIELTEIQSARGGGEKCPGLVQHRPFRAPHHSISDAGLIGGGGLPKPGEVTLAHRGVLFLDELPEFKKHVLELLRQPLSDGRVQISRARLTLVYPASFILVAAMNPCPCGYLGDRLKPCECPRGSIEKYHSRLSGPILDRIDMFLRVPRVPTQNLMEKPDGEASCFIAQRVQSARNRQKTRFRFEKWTLNSEIPAGQIHKFVQLSSEMKSILAKSMENFNFSARGLERILKMALTVQDLSGEESLQKHHLLEALQLRAQFASMGLAA